MLYILYGEDDYSLQQYLNELKKSVGDETVLAPNTSILEGASVTVDQLRSVCEVVPFLADKRLVIVNGLLARFDPKGGKGKAVSSQRSAVSAPGAAPNHKPFSEYLSTAPESTLLVLVDGPPERDKKARDKNPLLAEIAAKAKVVTFPELKLTELRAWIQKEAAGRGGSMSPAAIELLARTVGGNLWIMSNEIDKLIAYASSRQIEEADVNQLVSEAKETSIFSLVDAIVESRANAAAEMEKLLQRGTAPTHVLVMLARQLNFIVRAKDLRQQGKAPAEIRATLNIAQEFVLNRVLEQAGRYTMARLKEVYHKLLETDLAIKTGKYEGELALHMLVAELYQKEKQYA